MLEYDFSNLNEIQLIRALKSIDRKVDPEAYEAALSESKKRGLDLLDADSMNRFDKQVDSFYNSFKVMGYCFLTIILSWAGYGLFGKRLYIPRKLAPGTFITGTGAQIISMVCWSLLLRFYSTLLRIKIKSSIVANCARFYTTWGGSW